MTRIFKDGEFIPVTLVKVGPCKILQLKTRKKDGYESVQIGYKEITKKNLIKKSAGDKNYKHIKEFSSNNENEHKLGDIIDASFLKEGDKVFISGVSKGKGFQGAMKRWNFSGAATASHGTKHNNRKLGSIGSAYPQRVIKGRKMPGRMGSDRVTVKNLKVIKTDLEKNIIAVKGAIPGKPGTVLEINSLLTNKEQN